jgi:hypothetical protein
LGCNSPERTSEQPASSEVTSGPGHREANEAEIHEDGLAPTATFVTVGAGSSSPRVAESGVLRWSRDGIKANARQRQTEAQEVTSRTRHGRRESGRTARGFLGGASTRGDRPEITSLVNYLINGASSPAPTVALKVSVVALSPTSTLMTPGEALTIRFEGRIHSKSSSTRVLRLAWRRDSGSSHSKRRSPQPTKKFVSRGCPSTGRASNSTRRGRGRPPGSWRWRGFPTP